MASKSCASCLRVLHRQSIPQVCGSPPRQGTIITLPKARRIAPSLASRSFTGTSRHHAEPEYDVTVMQPATSIPPVTPKRAEGSSQAASTAKAVQELRKITGRATETYTAYGATEILYKQCARQADYSIPQAKDIDAEMPKTADGEDLGVGEGWWHTGMQLVAGGRNHG
jgi:cytochrome b pre-mRNA-processing protein 3